jgi:AcrR family transcriptional regulator
MARTAEANQRLREAQRAKILKSASKVFARLGRTATMADVASEAQVSQGLAYRYFASKEALFQTLVEQAMQTDPAELRSFLEMPGTPGERLALLVSRLVESRRERPEFYQLLDQVQSAETTPNDLRELIRKRGQTFLEVMRQLIIEGQAIGEIAAGDPVQLVTAVAACLEGLTRFALLDPEQFKTSCPHAGILLRMLQPGADQQ